MKRKSYIYTMPVRRVIPYNEGLYFITFTCYKWLRLIELTNAYDLIYQWFDYLKKQNHRIAGFVIMPNHVHVMIDFSKTSKSINKIIGDGKRFIAYSIVQRLKEKNETALLDKLQKAVTATGSSRGKKHEVWEESFDWKYCETADFAYQKLVYLHNNPCTGRWKLAKDAMAYEHSSARYYISGKHAAYEVVDVEIILSEKQASVPESLAASK
jgi:REP element-mobilizing transposase RayT